jgi:hypothetical protein
LTSCCVTVPDSSFVIKSCRYEAKLDDKLEELVLEAELNEVELKELVLEAELNEVELKELVLELLYREEVMLLMPLTIITSTCLY